MDDKKLIVSVILGTLLLVVGGVFFTMKSTKTLKVDGSSNVKVLAESTSHEWGKIGIDDGKVEKVFDIKNEGEEMLKLFNVTTSCMCTTAELILGDTHSPQFGMHSKSGFVLEVPGGETAKLKVVFDPAFHGPNGVGSINRQITVKTNDKEDPELSFMLTAMVVR